MPLPGNGVIFSTNFGPDEPVRPLPKTQPVPAWLFTDKEVTDEQRRNWDVVVHVPATDNPRLQARRFKYSPHIKLSDFQWSVWFDATHQPAVDLDTLGDALRYSDVACFLHPDRQTVQQEIEACKKYCKDDPARLDKTWAGMRDIGFPDDWGLFGTACLVRQHTPQIASLNALCLWGLEHWTVRDQVLFPWACWTLGIVPFTLSGQPRDDLAPLGIPTRPNPYFDVTVWD